MSFIDAQLKADPNVINKRDRGNTLLHVAAASAKPKVIQKLLNGGAVGHLQLLNDRGLTPLKCLEQSLSSDRDFVRAMHSGHVWKGHTEDQVRSMVLLKQAMGLPVGNQENIKWGCTCGSCISAVISPRWKPQLIGM